MRTLLMTVAVAALGLAVMPWALADGTSDTTLSTLRSDSEETSFGDLTTDALCEAASTTIAFAPAVIFKPGELKPGSVKLADVETLLHEPEEKWAVVELTGSQIKEALERSVSFAPTPRTFFLQVSGLTVVYDPNAPRKRKVQSITIGFDDLNEAKTYQVAMPESLADGGSGYFTIFGDATKIRTGSRGLAAVVSAYLDSEGTVSYTGQGRIVVGG